MADLNILVVNSKGGCGKTTVATNLATAYANAGLRVGLYDCDPQASARHWAASRSEDLCAIDLRFCPDPKTIETTTTQSYDVCVYDSAPGISNKPALQGDFEALLKLGDVIVVPMLSSAWDIQAGEHFITQLMTQRVWRARPRPIAVVSNRVNGNLTGQRRLQHFLSCSDVPAVAEFRESPVYADAGDNGQGVMEMKHNRAARKEFKAWRMLMSWIADNANSQIRTRLPAAPLAAPRAGTTRSREKQEQA